MKVHKGYKFRLEPTEEQEVKINKTLGCCRFIYNSILDRRIKAYRRRGESMSYIDTQNLLPQMKTYLPWLAEADSQALKYSCRQLDNAYKGFFKDGKGFPQFKRKRGEESYTTTKAKSIKVDDKYIQLPTLGKVRYRKSRNIEGRICKATIRRSASGKYYVSILCEVEVAPLPVKNAAIGLDVGIKSFAVDSNGNEHPNHKYLQKAEAKLKREQKKLSRKKKGSANWEKQRIKVVHCHEKVANKRKDTLHKLSSTLVKENQIICVEDLNVKGILRIDVIDFKPSAFPTTNFRFFLTGLNTRERKACTHAIQCAGAKPVVEFFIRCLILKVNLPIIAIIIIVANALQDNGAFFIINKCLCLEIIIVCDFGFRRWRRQIVTCTSFH